VTALVGKTPVKIETAVNTAVRPDQDVFLTFDPSHIRWMDATTGEALAH